MKNISQADIDKFLERIDKSKHAEAEAFIRFIQNSKDYDTCRLAIFGETFF